MPYWLPRIAISNLHKVTSKSFSNTMKRLYTYVDPKTGENASLISKETYGVIKKHAALLDSTIIYDRDFSYDYFGFKTLERSYLMKLDGKIVERPQHMLMRVAVGIHGEDIEAAIETYHLLPKSGLRMPLLLSSMQVRLSHSCPPASCLP